MKHPIINTSRQPTALRQSVSVPVAGYSVIYVALGNYGYTSVSANGADVICKIAKTGQPTGYDSEAFVRISTTTGALLNTYLVGSAQYAQSNYYGISQVSRRMGLSYTEITSSNNRLKVVDMTTGSEIWSFNPGSTILNNIYAITLSDDGSRMYVSYMTGESLGILYNVNSQTTLMTYNFGVQANYYVSKLSPSGKYVYLRVGGLISILDALTKVTIRQIAMYTNPDYSGVSSLYMDPTDSLISYYSKDTAGTTITHYIHRVSDGSLVSSAVLTNSATSSGITAGVSADLSTIAWHSNTGTFTTNLQTSTRAVTPLALRNNNNYTSFSLSQDGSVLCTSVYPGPVLIY